VAADAALAEVGNPEIVAVPGGSHRNTEIANWLRTVSPRRDTTAATHWLAGSILEQYGAHASRERVVVDGPVVTCSGTASVFRGALVIAEAYGGAELVQRIRAEAVAQRTSESAHLPFWQRLWSAIRRPGPGAGAGSAAQCTAGRRRGARSRRGHAVAAA
jgi:hypothetical protein